MLCWAAALLAHNALLRSGEVGVVAGKKFDASRDITWASFKWRTACAESGGRPWLTVDVVAIKDPNATHCAVPMAVRRRQTGGEEGADPLCTYDALARVWRARQALVPVDQRTHGRPSATPFFVKVDGVTAWDSSDMLHLAQEMGTAVGIALHDLGGKSFRIGGATDLRAALGDAASKALIIERGRWESDFGLMYQRALVASHLEASASIGDASGAEFEAMCEGWVQPSAFR